MVNERDPDRVDWLDLGPEPDLHSSHHHSRRWRWWGLLLAAMAAALLLTRNEHVPQPLSGVDAASAGATQSPSALAGRPLPGPSQSWNVGAPMPGAPSGSTPAQHGRARAVTVTDLGHPLLPGAGNWELFGQGPGVVVRVELGRGRITHTSVPDVGSASPIFFVVGQDRAIVHPMDFVQGYVVRDGMPAAPLPPALDQAASTLPGPDLRHLWAETRTGTATALSLLTMDGRPAGVQIPIPKDATVQASDRAGNVIMFGIGGMYDLRQDGMHRITSGTLLAVGPTRWLTLECDERYQCRSMVIDRATGARRAVNAMLDAYEQNAGAISPDGRMAALLQPNRIGASAVHLLDLTTGADLLTGVTTSSDQTLGGRTLVWSPDSRWLFVTDGAGRVLAMNRAGRSVVLDVQVGPIDQIALRAAPR